MTHINELAKIFDDQDIDETIPQHLGIIENAEEWYETVYKPYITTNYELIADVNSQLTAREIDKDILFQEIEKGGIQFFMQGPVGIFDYKVIAARSVKLETLDLSKFKILYSALKRKYMEYENGPISEFYIVRGILK